MAQRGLCWKEDEMGELVPVWARSPDISVIRSLAVKHLPESHDNVDVTFFAEGSFNKLYCVSSPDIPQDYLIRVALPVDPFFKTESEVATLAYIQRTIEPELRELRKDWEKVRLRRLYTQTLQNDIEVSPDIMRKRKFSDCLENIEINWTASRYWARGVLQEARSMKKESDQGHQTHNVRLDATLDG
ncbi:hypothetical protein BDV24DRAFT_161804 [Aspergillus arachidicola]|uniref:Uncharacterized protein n=1 Tax=Aspergillus arachidicola TaxID=656916 RepID=A0A5N6YBX1_9EURO|nr:hypothetical protein BDV24DRAFT_161804 [Aspergillus arachidicola]